MPTRWRRIPEPRDTGTFWDELVERLVFRDLVRQEGRENLLQMNIIERFKKEDPIRGKYSREFEAYGLENLIVPAQGVEP